MIKEKIYSEKEIWLITGSQHLYGAETLKKVSEHAEKIAVYLDGAEIIPAHIVQKKVVATPADVNDIVNQINVAGNCIGVISWCHTFSPSKMWINGLKKLQKPLLHLHTQFNRDLPWEEIDMDFMNLNQSAHGDREHGFIMSRMRMNRKVVVGHWQDEAVIGEISDWIRAAAGWNELQHLKIARFGDNMREVAVTEGDKVAAQLQLGLSVNGYSVGDLVQYVNAVDEAAIDRLMEAYMLSYETGNAFEMESLRYQARLEIGIQNFLEEGGFGAFTTTFEDLHGLKQLPGLAVQRLMAAGYGFGAEGDWKHAALVRVCKVMGRGLDGGCSFMEDYTYHLNPKGQQVLGAHMLEICPSIAAEKPKIAVYPLGIGGKEAPARLIFNVPSGHAINASLIDLGNRFRMIINEVDCVVPPSPMPGLPVARALWVPQPNLKTAAQAWIYAGGAHHTAFTMALNQQIFNDFCEIADIELIIIDKQTDTRQIKKQLQWNEVFYLMSNGFSRV